MFLSPPWGGVGYELLQEYTLEHVFPEFDRIIDKATQYSPNLLIYLPKNTSIADLTRRLCRFQNRLIGERRLAELENQSIDTNVGELSIEIEQLIVRGACRAIVVYTGDLARIKPKHVAQCFINTKCAPTVNYTHNYKSSRGGSSKSSVSSMKSDDRSLSGKQTMSHQAEYLKAILTNVFTVSGYKNFTKYVKGHCKTKPLISKVVKQIQKNFSPEEWYYLRKIHKKEKNYFLNKGGARGDQGGGGWVSRSSKSTRSKPESQINDG